MNSHSITVSIKQRKFFRAAMRVIVMLNFLGLISSERAGKFIADHCVKFEVK